METFEADLKGRDGISFQVQGWEPDNRNPKALVALVHGLGDDFKYSLVAGAVTGGGLTVIANAPNPAGQSILGRFFPEGVSPLGLFLGAAAPTAFVTLCFLLLQ